MDLDLLETPGTKQVTKSKKRRSVRICRKSQGVGLGLVFDEDTTDDVCPVTHSQDVDIAAVASDVGQICEEKNLQASQNQYGSVWMDTDSPEMAELVIRRNRRKSRVHLPIMSVIDGLDSPVILNQLDPNLNLNDHHLSMELSRTGDATNSPETNGIGSRLSGSYIVPQTKSPLVDTSGTTGSGHGYLRFNSPQEKDCDSVGNSFSECLTSDISNGSLSPCFEACDYNIGKTFQYLDSSPQQNHNSFDASKTNRTNSTKGLTYSQNLESRKIVLSPVEESRTLVGTTQGLTSGMTPVDKSSMLSSDLTSGLTPYSPSQPIFKNISPPNCGSLNSTFSPIYLTPADKITRSKVVLDVDKDDEDIWKTCKKTIDGNVGQTPGTDMKTKALISTQKKMCRSNSKSLTEVPSKQQTSGFLSICRSLAGKLANAVRNSPDGNNQMSSSDDSFTSIKPINASNEAATVIVNSSVETFGEAVSVSTADNTDTGTTVSTSSNSNILNLGDGNNLLSPFSYDEKSGQTSDLSDSNKCVSPSLSVITPKDEEDGINYFVCENIAPSRPAECSNEAVKHHLDACFDYIDPEPVQEAHIISDLSSQTGQHVDKIVSLGSGSPKLSTVVEMSDPVHVTGTSKLASDKLRKVKTKHKRTGRKSMGLVSHGSSSCELSESVNKLSLNAVSDMDTCVHVVSTDSCTDNGSKPIESKSAECDVGALFTGGANFLKQKEHAQKTASSKTMSTKEQLAPRDVGDTPSVEDQSTSQNSADSEAALALSVVEVKKRRPRKSMSNTIGEKSLVLKDVSVVHVSTSSAAKKKSCPQKPANSGVAVIKEKALSLENMSGKMSSVCCEPISTSVESDPLSTIPPVSLSEVEEKGCPRKVESVSDKLLTGMCVESIPTCVENDPLPSLLSVSEVKKRGRPRKSMSLIPPFVIEKVPDVNLSSQTGAELQETSKPQLFNSKTVKDSTDIQNSKQKSMEDIKVLTAEDLKSLDEYLGIEDPEPVIVPPPKKRGRPRKSVDGQMQTKVLLDPAAVSADKHFVSRDIDKTVASGTTEQEATVSQKNDSRMMDVQTMAKDTLVEELEDLELLERPKRKSTRIQRRSIEIYRQIQTANSAEEDVPMSPLELVEESKPTTAVLQDVSSNHGNTRNDQEPTMKVARKRKLTKNEPTVEDIYKNKNFKRPAPKIWETIYEAPSEEQVFSKKRYRRSIMFDESLIVPPAKTKLRLRKAVKNGMDPRQRRRKMLSDVAVKKKLAKMQAILEDDD